MPTVQKYAAISLQSAKVAKISPHVHQPVRSGALTILIAVVIIALSVLSVLALATARADLALTKRQQARAQQVATAESLAQSWLEQVASIMQSNAGLRPEITNEALAALLSSPTSISQQGLVQTVIELEDVKINISLQINSSKKGYEIVRWAISRDWQPDETINVWGG